MKKTIFKTVALLLVVVMIATAFTACGGESVAKPTAATVKQDIGDVTFTFTYAQLRDTGMSKDQLASLFETTNRITDDKTISISYYELVSKFGEEDYFENILALIPADQMAKLIGNEEAILNYFNTLINDIKANGSARVSSEEEFWINHDERVVFKDVNGNELPNQDELRAAFRIYADNSLKGISQIFNNVSQEDATEIGADLTDAMYLYGSKTASTLTVDDLYLDAETRTYPAITSLIPTLENDLDEKGKNAEDKDGEYIFVPTEWNRTINLSIKPQEESVKKVFSIRAQDEILKYFDVAKAYMTVNSFSLEFEPCFITAGINAATDEMTYCTYQKNMLVTMNITFTGTLAQYGTVLITFPCTNQITFKFGWESTAN